VKEAVINWAKQYMQASHDECGNTEHLGGRLRALNDLLDWVDGLKEK